MKARGAERELLRTSKLPQVPDRKIQKKHASCCIVACVFFCAKAKKCKNSKTMAFLCLHTYKPTCCQVSMSACWQVCKPAYPHTHKYASRYTSKHPYPHTHKYTWKQEGKPATPTSPENYIPCCGKHSNQMRDHFCFQGYSAFALTRRPHPTIGNSIASLHADAC